MTLQMHLHCIMKIFTITTSCKQMRNKVRRGPAGKGPCGFAFRDRSKYNRHNKFGKNFQE